MSNGELRTCSDLYIHWDTNYWYSVYIFLILQGALIVAYTQILINSNIINNELKYLEGIAISGVILTIVWIFILNKKFAFTYWSQEELKELSGFNIWKNVNDTEKNIPYLASIPSSIFMNDVLPILFIAFWFILERGILKIEIIAIIGFIFLILLLTGIYLKKKITEYFKKKITQSINNN